ncbi:hypothetical protein DFJ74DRAFT_708505 [Hyaloraphidium curvatum]|nr:hypothetical protein DFJ74DRAFT_708505 [Hyaloraphidium curvatum]
MRQAFVAATCALGGLALLPFLHAVPPAPPWRRWQRCWAHGAWVRLDAEARARRNAGPCARAPTRPADDWRWQSAACAARPFRAFDAADFCRLLGGRDVLLAGDSLQLHMREALAARARGAADPPDAARFPFDRPVLPPLHICGASPAGPARVVALRNFNDGQLRVAADLPFRHVSQLCRLGPLFNASARGCAGVSPSLVAGSSDDRFLGIDEFLGTWADAIGLDPAVVVLNAGAHYQPDNLRIPWARKAIAAAVRLRPRALVVWRDTPPGHANCSRIFEPLSAPQEPAWALPFAWGKFAGQNAKIAEMVEREFPGVVYMDVATATALRGDLHRSAAEKVVPDDSDCLHYALGGCGPASHWTVALYNVMRAAGI